LYCRRSGIEALISQTKHGGQLERSWMKSDRTTLSAGYAAVLGFNLRHNNKKVKLEMLNFILRSKKKEC